MNAGGVLTVKKLSGQKLRSLLLSVFILVISAACFADNPIVDYVFTADPAGFIANDRLYVICSHDLDDQTNYNMHDYYMLSTDDLVTWQDHGIVFDSRRDTSWAWLAYAPDMAVKDGKYYLYFPDGADSIGVAVADSPGGPFRDPLGKSLVNKDMPNCNVQWCFDPGVFMDDDGSAYLYFGGGGPGNARVIRLGSDMISVSGEAVTIDAPNFFEASYMHKRDGIYYFSYSTNPSSGMKIDYMTSSSPMTGFHYQGTILPNPWDNLGNNNHHSIVEYNGQWYIFYHNRAVSGSVYQRSVCIDYLYYNSDGTIMTVSATREGVNPGVTSNPSPAPTPIPTSCADAPEWNPNMAYEVAGTVVRYNDNLYENKWYSLGDNPEEKSGEYDVWLFLESCDPQGTTAPTAEPTSTPATTSAPTTPPTPTPTAEHGTLGDLNGSGQIDIVDALLTAQYYVVLNPSGFIAANADTNCSGVTDIVDALLIAQYYVGLINQFC